MAQANEARAPFESIKLELMHTEAVSNDDDITIRTIHLTPDNPTVTVGRSSKTVSKGLMPAHDNAYFDIPVMSRKHAEFEADFDKGVVLLTDTDSLHGTSVNGVSITKSKPQALTSGDVVRFGTHVARGLEVFSPAGVKVDFVAVKAKCVDDTSSSYKAPEYISDDGSECECTDDNNHSNTDVSGLHNDSDDVVALDDSDSDGDSLYDPANPDKTLDTEEDLGRRCSIYLADHGEYEDSDDDESEADDEGASTDSDLEVQGALVVIHDGDSEEDSDFLDEGDQDIEDDEIDADSDDAEDGADDEGAKDGQDVGDYLMTQIARFDALSAGYLTGEAFCGNIPAEGGASKDNAEHVDTEMSMDVHGDVENVTPGGEGAPQRQDETAVPVTPTLAKNRCNISSILNPSPPPSRLNAAFGTESSVCDSNVGNDSAGLDSKSSIQLPAIVEVMESLQQDELLIAQAEAESAQVENDAPKSENEEPELESQPPSEKSTLLESGKRFLNSAPREPFVVTYDEDEIDNIAMESAAVFNSYKKQNASKKRKAEEMVEDVNAYVLESPPVPSPKRQATSAAMRAGSVPKNRLLAVAEKIGIAALGGAVVLGSLIYTAPTF